MVWSAVYGTSRPLLVVGNLVAQDAVPRPVIDHGPKGETALTLRAAYATTLASGRDAETPPRLREEATELAVTLGDPPSPSEQIVFHDSRLSIRDTARSRASSQVAPDDMSG